MMLQFCLLISTLPLQEISGCRRYLTRSKRGGAYLERSERGGAYLERSEHDGGARADKRGRRDGRTFEGKICR